MLYLPGACITKSGLWTDAVDGNYPEACLFRYRFVFRARLGDAFATVAEAVDTAIEWSVSIRS